MASHVFSIIYTELFLTYHSTHFFKMTFVASHIFYITYTRLFLHNITLRFKKWECDITFLYYLLPWHHIMP